MDLETLRDEVNYLLGFKSGSPDQDFTGTTAYSDKRIDSAINKAVRKEYTKAVNECGAEKFTRRMTFTWESGDVTRKLPVGVNRESIVSMADTTSDSRGQELWVGGRFSLSDIIWRDNTTLEWGRSGPASDRTISVDYIAKPATLSEETHRPEVIPEDYHDLLVWTAGIILRKTADEAAPRSWTDEQLELRLDMHKFLSTDGPIINNREDNNIPYYEGV